MKIFFAIFIFWFNIPYSNGADFWVKQIGTTAADIGTGVAVDSTGNSIYVTGSAAAGLDGNTSAGGKDMVLIKYDANGTKIWSRQLGTPELDTGNAVVVDGTGKITVAGYTANGSMDGNTSKGNLDIFFTQYDANGNKLWTRQIGTISPDHARGITVDNTNNLYVSGITEGGMTPESPNGYGDADVFLVKYDSSGNAIWTKTVGSPRFDFSFGIAADRSAGTVYFTGYSATGFDGNTSAGFDDAILTKYDSNGTKLWSKQFGTAKADGAYAIATDSTGNLYIVGYTYSAFPGNVSAGGVDYFIAKYDSSGNQVWIKQHGTIGSEWASGVKVANNGYIYVTGSTSGEMDGNYNAGSHDVFLAKFDSTGNKFWTKLFGTVTYDYCNGIAIDNNDVIYLAGETSAGLEGNTPAGEADIFLIKIKPTENSGTIRGKITKSDGTTPISGAKVEIIRASVMVSTTTTDINGNYTFTLGPDTYDVKVQMLGYQTQTSNNVTVTVNVVKTVDLSLTEVTLPTYYVKGYVKDSVGTVVSGVTLSLTGSATSSKTTNTLGYYEFTGLVEGGNYTVTPGKTGYTFNPVNKTYTNLTVNQDNQDYTGTISSGSVVYTIKGYVRDAVSTGIYGTVVTLSGNKTGTYTVDNTGYYEFTNLNTGNYTVTVFKPGYGFNPSTRNYNPLNIDQTDQNFTGWSTSVNYYVKGYVRDNAGTGITNVTVTISGTNTGAYVTNAQGYYEFLNLPSSGTYTIIPTKSGYSFNPVNNGIPSLTANQENVNFTGTILLYSIKGTVTSDSTAKSGVILTLSGTTSATFTSLSNGTYEFLNLVAGGNYTVTPSLAGYSFNPTNRSYIGLSSNQSNQDFTAILTPVTYYLKGYVKDGTGSAISGVSVTLSGESSGMYTTDTNGYYEFLNLRTGSYTVSVNKTGYTFTSNVLTVNLSTNLENQNFTGSLIQSTYYLKGYVKDNTGSGVSGVTLTLSGTSQGTFATDNTGYYEFLNLAGNGNYTVTPNRSGYSLNPVNLVYPNLTGNQDTQNFSATLIGTSYYLKGYVKRNDGTPVSKVTVDLNIVGVGKINSTVTGTDGYYEFVNLGANNYEVAVTRPGFTFTPDRRSYVPLSSNRDTQDFTVVTVKPIDSVKPAELHFTAGSGVRKKIKELKEKIEHTRP